MLTWPGIRLVGTESAPEKAPGFGGEGLRVTAIASLLILGKWATAAMTRGTRIM